MPSNRPPNILWICTDQQRFDTIEKIVVYHGIEEGEIYDLAADPDEFDNLYYRADESDRRQRLLKQAFDASVFTMDPMPPRLGPFQKVQSRGSRVES